MSIKIKVGRFNFELQVDKVLLITLLTLWS
jgi:hypothetical protein